MEKLFFEYLCQLEKALPAVKAQEVVERRHFKGRAWGGFTGNNFVTVTLPTAPGCSKLDSAWLFNHFFGCFAPVWYGHGMAISR